LLLTLSGLLGSAYQIHYRNTFDGTNDWQTLPTFPLGVSPFTWSDPQSADLPSRFYRAVLLP
jgi:hypothetical protein